MAAAEGLRERKKQRTAAAIRAAAVALFAERGFEQVPVIEIARRAEVSQATVYNHFPTKEDLIFRDADTLESALIRAVRERRIGQSLVDAFRGFLLDGIGLLPPADPAELRELVAINRLIADSPVLRARERQRYDDATAALATAVALAPSLGGDTTQEAPAHIDPVTAWIAANALVGVHRALADYVRHCLLAGTPAPAIRRGVRSHAALGLRAVEHGLAALLASPS